MKRSKVEPRNKAIPLQTLDGWCRVSVSAINIIPNRILLGSDAPTRQAILQKLSEHVGNAVARKKKNGTNAAGIE